MKIIDGDALKKRILNKLGVRSAEYLLPAEKAIYELIDEMPPLEGVCPECGAKVSVVPKLGDEEAKKRIFSMLISCQISTYTNTYAPDEAVVSMGNILKCIEGLTRYKAGKALKTLREDGLVIYTSQGCPAVVSYGECPELLCDAAPPINGYALTKKAYDTAEWKQAYKDWEQSMEDWANGFQEVGA